MLKSEFISRCKFLAEAGEEFLFMVDYELDEFYVLLPDEAYDMGCLYSIHGKTNSPGFKSDWPSEFHFDQQAISFERYHGAFKLVKRHISHGNSFLLNLTFPTTLQTNANLEQIFAHSNAPYKLFFKDRFVVFSPESFIQIKGNRISTYPMKGTIDANQEQAEKRIMENEKEKCEHVTIVDLLRNDLSRIARNVELKRFRYIDRLRTHKGELLQVSSEISGILPENWRSDLGNILLELLPAGSICGAPKKKTLEIIADAEGQDRGFFTGVFGICNSSGLDSAVMIRYIEKTEHGLQFRSGGGITGKSDPEQEYQEMIAKVYVPIT